MESWRKVWREGILPQLPVRALKIIHAGLLEDDSWIVQGKTTDPQPMQCSLDLLAERGDILSYVAVNTHGVLTVGQCEEFFANVCFETDQRLGEPGAVRYFLNWYDGTPRDEMRRLMLEEIDHNLKERRACQS